MVDSVASCPLTAGSSQPHVDTMEFTEMVAACDRLGADPQRDPHHENSSWVGGCRGYSPLGFESYDLSDRCSNHRCCTIGYLGS